MWVARFLRAVPAIQYDFPKARFIFLTLTVRNCDVKDLRSTLKEMNESFHRLVKRKEFPAIGFVKSLEVTRSEIGEAHPHFHILMMVNSSYFDGKNYLSQERWGLLWKDCLRISYDPMVNVKAIKPKKGKPESEALPSAICETFKYSIKPADLISDKDFLLELTNQLHKTRAVSLGGEFKNYLIEDEPDDLIGESEKLDELLSSSVTFGWREMLNRYVQVSK
jgi:plasmid rolling circle replication initiator protein Rep